MQLLLFTWPKTSSSRTPLRLLASLQPALLFHRPLFVFLCCCSGVFLLVYPSPQTKKERMQPASSTHCSPFLSPPSRPGLQYPEIPRVCRTNLGKSSRAHTSDFQVARKGRKLSLRLLLSLRARAIVVLLRLIRLIRGEDPVLTQRCLATSTESRASDVKSEWDSLKHSFQHASIIKPFSPDLPRPSAPGMSWSGRQQTVREGWERLTVQCWTSSTPYTRTSESGGQSRRKQLFRVLLE